MLAQRHGLALDQREAAADASEPAVSSPAPAASTTKSGSRKLTYKDQLALDKLPGRIAEIEAKIVKLRTALEDPDLYSKDPKGFARQSEALDSAERDLTTAEELWLELETRREALQSD